MFKKLSHKLRFYYTLIALGLIGISTLLFGLLTIIVDLFTPLEATSIPALIFVLILSTVIGTAFAFLFSWKIFAPITTLDRALRKVAAGDFSVQLEYDGRIDVIRNIYEDFNLMTRELGTMETLRSDFVSNVSHEFKTPISAIEGYAMLLQDPTQSSEEQAECADKILYNAHRLSDLVGNILLISRVENQNMPFEKKSYRLDEQIREAIVLLEPKWAEKEIDFDVDLQNIEYLGAQGPLYHVWSNLIGNAIKFSSPGGLIRIRLYRESDSIVFSVEDTGPGISKEDQSRIFEKFYQADASHKSEGNGLGLALARKILDVIGGTIGVYSALGEGAVFTVRLPDKK